VLLEAWRHFADDSYADLALRASRGLAAAVDGHEDDSLYFGRSGMALVLYTLRDELDDTASGAAADRAKLSCVHASTGSAGASCSS
jgi:hypothetical protein